jgi:putative ABC transport system ATP-binding protein
VSTPEGIRLESVCKLYESAAGVVRAVDGITLEVEPGRSLAITGPSGCGKSTLLGLMAGLDAPTSGGVWIGARQISSLRERERARLRRDELGLVFQADNLLPFLTAVENVGLQLAMRGSPDGREQCVDLLVRFGLGGEVDKLPDQLSGGQRQRVAVARALVHRPAVILADEPTGSLDAESAAVVIDLLVAAQHELGATVVVVTHDLEVAQRLDRTLSLRDGRTLDDSALPAPLGYGRVGA